MGERIALGLGDNTDCEIRWDSSVVEQLILEYHIKDSELRTNGPIIDERDLVVSILGFLKRGRGGERFVESERAIDKFAQRFKNKITIGGTSVRAAIAMRKLGHRSALHLVTMNEHVRRLIPDDCPWVCSRRTDSSYPHLIVQFERGTVVRSGDIDIQTERANRLIYNNDYDNIRMEIDSGFAALLSDALVLLISGFNAMQSKELLTDRLEKVYALIGTLPRGARVFYEDACFHVPGLSKKIREKLGPLFQIHSLNEDEMEAYLGRQVALLGPCDVYVALRELHRFLSVPVLIVHTRHWALAYGEDASSFEDALNGGIAMATTRFRFGDDFGSEQYAETLSLPPEKAAVTFCADLRRLAGERICCLPSFQVAETTATTIGLGDAFVGGFLPALV